MRVVRQIASDCVDDRLNEVLEFLNIHTTYTTDLANMIDRRVRVSISLAGPPSDPGRRTTPLRPEL